MRRTRTRRRRSALSLGSRRTDTSRSPTIRRRFEPADDPAADATLAKLAACKAKARPRIKVWIPQVSDWSIDYETPRSAWLVTPRGWYRALAPAPEYAPTWRDGAQKKFDLATRARRRQGGPARVVRRRAAENLRAAGQAKGKRGRPRKDRSPRRNKRRAEAKDPLAELTRPRGGGAAAGRGRGRRGRREEAASPASSGRLGEEPDGEEGALVEELLAHLRDAGVGAQHHILGGGTKTLPPSGAREKEKETEVSAEGRARDGAVRGEAQSGHVHRGRRYVEADLVDRALESWRSSQEAAREELRLRASGKMSRLTCSRIIMEERGEKADREARRWRRGTRGAAGARARGERQSPPARPADHATVPRDSADKVRPAAWEWGLNLVRERTRLIPRP